MLARFMSQAPTIDVDYVANLARLDLTAEEKARFAAQLGDILAYFEKLNAVDVTGVEPTAHAFPVFNVLDEDVERSGFTVAEALRNAPAVRDNQIVVPKVVEDA
jgi:aspartyl-tRNA(Asn)/glutamyl-tRNA(Gln) amidotransferase subunit C